MEEKRAKPSFRNFSENQTDRKVIEDEIRITTSRKILFFVQLLILKYEK
jgi:hypothetical protein